MNYDISVHITNDIKLGYKTNIKILSKDNNCAVYDETIYFDDINAVPSFIEEVLKKFKENDTSNTIT